MANTVDKVIKIATAEIGYLEKSKIAYQKNSKILDEMTRGAGYDNYTKYGRDMHKIYPSVMDFPAPWCDCFVDWCFYKAYGVTTAKSLIDGNFDDYTVASAQMYMNKKAYYKAPCVPKVGDQIFFKNAQGGICHTGLVYAVSDTTVYTIEGNTSSSQGVIANGGGVFKKSYPLGYSRIHGYGRPKYDADKKKTSTSKKSDAPAVAKPTLKNGNIGAEVTKLQKDLNYLGFKGKNGKKLTVDGEFGTNTTYALKQFQKKYKLEVDGIYGAASCATMKSKVK